MTHLTEAESRAVMAAQRGVPLEPQPFRAIGEACGMDEGAVAGLFRRLLASGDARRIGGIFDARRLGFRSALCCADMPEAELATYAANVSAEDGVTHAYERGWPAELPLDSRGGPGARHWPNFWFTLAAPAEAFDAALARVRAECAPHSVSALPASRRFKIDVVFDVRTRERDERVEPPGGSAPHADGGQRLAEGGGAAEAVSGVQREIIRLFQGRLEADAAFFAKPAEALGMSEEALLAQLRAWRDSGVLRRIALLLRHREMGFRANGMCCWRVAPENALAAGRRLAAFAEVTHCYERPVSEAFPYNVYAMIHCRSWSEAQGLFGHLARATGLSGGQLLLSLREFKKTSLRLF